MKQLTNSEIIQIDNVKEKYNESNIVGYIKISDEPKLHATYSSGTGFAVVIFAATPYEAVVISEKEYLVDFANRCNQVLNDLNTEPEPDYLKLKYNAAQLFEQQLTGWDAGNQSASVEDLVKRAGLTKLEWQWLVDNGEVDWFSDDIRSDIVNHLYGEENE